MFLYFDITFKVLPSTSFVNVNVLISTLRLTNTVTKDLSSGFTFTLSLCQSTIQHNHSTYLLLYFPKIFSTFLLIPEVLFWKLSQNKLKLVCGIVQQYCNKKEFFPVDDCYSCDQGIPRIFSSHISAKNIFIYHV